MKVNKVHATYQGHSDSQFVQNNSYELIVIQGWFGRLVVIPVHQGTGKPLTDFKQGYHCLDDLLHNWLILRSTSKDHQTYGWKG